MSSKTKSFDRDSLVRLCRCPDCSGDISEADGHLFCEQCRARFHYDDGVLDLRPAVLRGEGGRTKAVRHRRPKWMTWFVGAVYARHNASRAVRRGIEHVLASASEAGVVLNIGSGTSGNSQVHSRSINLDIVWGEAVDVLGDAHRLPFRNEAITCIISQEVFEHLRDPQTAIAEAARVLAPQGLLYLQVPFIIGHHGIPYDFQRFTQAGLRELVRRAQLDVVQSGPSVGAGTSLYRIMVEFFPAIAAGIGLRPLYKVIKGTAALILAPLRLFDAISPESDTLNRIHGGYYVIARKQPTVGGSDAP